MSLSVFVTFHVLQCQHSPVNAKTDSIIIYNTVFYVSDNDCVCVVIWNGVPEIASEVRQTPDIILNSLGLAFHQVISHDSVCPIIFFQCQ